MKRATKFFLAAGFCFALAFTFSCSSDDSGGGGTTVGGGGGTTISCQTSNACVEVSAEACLELQGQLVQSCDATNPKNSSSSNNKDVACQEQSGYCTVMALEICQNAIGEWQIVPECPPIVGCISKTGLCSNTFNSIQCQKAIEDYNGLYVSMVEGGCPSSSSSSSSVASSSSVVSSSRSSSSLSSSVVSSSSLQLSSSSFASSSSSAYGSRSSSSNTDCYYASRSNVFIECEYRTGCTGTNIYSSYEECLQNTRGYCWARDVSYVRNEDYLSYPCLGIVTLSRCKDVGGWLYDDQSKCISYGHTH